MNENVKQVKEIAEKFNQPVTLMEDIKRRPPVPHKPGNLSEFQKRASYIPQTARQERSSCIMGDESFKSSSVQYSPSHFISDSLSSVQVSRPLSSAPLLRPRLIEQTLPDQNDLYNEQTLKTRKTIINEIITTEEHYLSDLLILKHVFIKKAVDQSLLEKEDLRLLFGNIDPIIDLSTDILTELKRYSHLDQKTASSGEYTKKDPKIANVIYTGTTTLSHGQIGKTFLHFIGEIKIKYGNYCKNNEDSLDKLKEIMNNSKFHSYFTECQEEMNGQTDAWDLASLIIKPVQRVLKYPLLLSRLLEYTDERDGDYGELVQAVASVKDVAQMINELKKRKGKPSLFLVSIN